jgi:hypothetical protein
MPDFILRPAKFLGKRSLPQQRDLICSKEGEADATPIWPLQACQCMTQLPYSTLI